MFWPLNFFGGAPPKIFERHYKIRPSTDHRAKFQAGRPTHLGDLALGKKFQKTSGLKLKSAPQAIASGRTKNNNAPRCWMAHPRDLNQPEGETEVLNEQKLPRLRSVLYCSGTTSVLFHSKVQLPWNSRRRYTTGNGAKSWPWLHVKNAAQKKNLAKFRKCLTPFFHIKLNTSSAFATIHPFSKVLQALTVD